ncbi:hypothetical protein EDC01DRAFT_485833 [Geopyxis carbonaria]|nr:hypothetical protein EDC01DRAFT_485833 [Geopyxis carbonaria]
MVHSWPRFVHVFGVIRVCSAAMHVPPPMGSRTWSENTIRQPCAVCNKSKTCAVRQPGARATELPPKLSVVAYGFRTAHTWQFLNMDKCSFRYISAVCRARYCGKSASIKLRSGRAGDFFNLSIPMNVQQLNYTQEPTFKKIEPVRRRSKPAYLPRIFGMRIEQLLLINPVRSFIHVPERCYISDTACCKQINF